MSAIYRALIATMDRRIPQDASPLDASNRTQDDILLGAHHEMGSRVGESVRFSSTHGEDLPRQTSSLVISGLIWQRYAWVIKPRNYWLMSVNCLVAITNSIQLGRVLQYKLAHPESCSQAH